MGLFDRFKKNKQDDSIEALVEKTDKLIEKSEQIGRIDQEEEKDIFKKAIARYDKEMEFKSLRRRIEIIKELILENKIKVSGETMDRINEWLKAYQEQMSGYDYEDTSAPDLVIPEFPITADDIYYPKKNLVISNPLSTLLDYTNVSDDINLTFSIYKEFFKPINGDEELISLLEGKKMENEIVGRHK